LFTINLSAINKVQARRFSIFMVYAFL